MTQDNNSSPMEQGDTLIHIQPSMQVKLRTRKSKFIDLFWKPKEKPQGVLCCQFATAKFSNGCLYGCEYCYLKNTFKYGIDKTAEGKDANGKAKPWNGEEQVVFSNVDDLYKEVKQFLDTQKTPMVLHTGEVADSLAVPGSEDIMAPLIEMFAEQKKHTLLLLTKSANVDNLLYRTGYLDREEKERTVFGFSVNVNEAAELYEKGTASPVDRLDAAQKCINAAYRVMIRVDPMIPIPSWRSEYRKLFNYLNNLTYEGLYGIVVGTLRAFPQLKSKLSPSLQEMLTHWTPADGRWHIDPAIRDEMYGLAFTTLKSERLGICKETGEMWASLGKKYGFRKFVCNCHL